MRTHITIKKRFLSLINNYNEEIKTSNKNLKENLYRKVEYIKNVYDYFLKNNLNYKDFTDSEVTKELTKIKGIGKWTAEMFLIFILFRKNIFSNGDLALINSIKVNYNINNLSNKKLDDLITSGSTQNNSFLITLEIN